jgi:DNA replication and repair protein RecF
MSATIRFERVVVQSFRNLSEVELEPAARLNVISGDNGHGKTSLLEALYVLATSRSFRAEKAVEIVQHGSARAQIAASIADAGIRREQRAMLAAAARSFSIDGKRVARLSSYATRTPVVVFHPGDLALVGGGATLRRTLLDRVALFVEPVSAEHRARYVKAVRERQRALELGGIRSPDVDAFEELAAEHGAALTAARARASARLVAAVAPAFVEMAAPGLDLAARFVPGGSDVASDLRRAFADSRAADLGRGSARFGPHRDDLELLLDGRLARRHASQGQQRLLALALKLAELDCVRAARGADPVLLLDDVSSELDPERFTAVFAFLRREPGQVFVTTPRPELFRLPGLEPTERADFALREGVLSRLESAA